MLYGIIQFRIRVPEDKWRCYNVSSNKTALKNENEDSARVGDIRLPIIIYSGCFWFTERALN